MALYELAKKVANFAWDIDPYNARDCYDTFGEAVSETLIGLSNRIQRKAIYDWLLSVETETEYANVLAKEVAAL